MKKLLYIAGIAGVHFVVTRLVDVLVRGMAAGAYQNAASAALKVLIWVSTVLYFPVVTLALYPRHLFPGNWIFVPMAANSLVWSVGIIAVWHLGGKLFGQAD